MTLDKCRARIEALAEQRADIDATIEELESFCDVIAKLMPKTANQ